MTTVPYTQTVVADKGGTPDDNANPVADTGGGATLNKEFFQECKELRTASECAHDPAQVGKFISEEAHIHNKPQ